MPLQKCTLISYNYGWKLLSVLVGFIQCYMRINFVFKIPKRGNIVDYSDIVMNYYHSALFVYVFFFLIVDDYSYLVTGLKYCYHTFQIWYHSRDTNEILVPHSWILHNIYYSNSFMMLESSHFSRELMFMLEYRLPYNLKIDNGYGVCSNSNTVL